MSIDQQFVEYIVKSIVGSPDEVEVKRTVDERGVLLELTVAPDDLGRVIGKRGSGAQAIRTLLRALGTKNDARYNLKIVDNDAPESSDKKSFTPKEEKPTDIAEDSTPTPAPVEDTSNDDIDDDDDSDDEEVSSNSRAEQTRKELADLDDLDI